MERFEKEGGLEYFDERDSVEFLLDLSRCPGDHAELADRLLDEFGSLKGILEAREEQLKNIYGIGRRTIIMIRSVVPFVKTWARISMEEKNRIGNIQEAETYCKSLLMGLRNEQMYTICLNSGCYILGKRMISNGSLSEVNAYPRIIIETALNYNAHSILLCHNHPGGTNQASSEDISSTLQIQRILDGIGILLLDHIIVAGCDAYSMIQHGDIDYKRRGG